MHAFPAAVADLWSINPRVASAMSTRIEQLDPAPPAERLDSEGGDRQIERLCDLAAVRTGLIRGVAPALKACAGYDPGLDCCVVYYRLGKGEEDRLDEHRDVVVAELERWQFRLLATGPAERALGEDPAYSLLVDASNDDVTDLRAAMVRADQWWARGWPEPETLDGPAGCWRGEEAE